MFKMSYNDAIPTTECQYVLLSLFIAKFVINLQSYVTGSISVVICRVVGNIERLSVLT